MSTSPGIPTALREKLEALCAHSDDLDAQLSDPEVLADHRQVRDISVRKAALAPVVTGYRSFASALEEAGELRDLIRAGEDDELVSMAKEELPALESRATELIETVKAALVNADDRAVGSIMMEVRAGAGGDEAGLWARDLLQMYERYATQREWAYETLDASIDAGLGGVRHAVVNIRGEGVWSELAFEAGVHSVKRVPVTESQGRVHTSTATVAVLPEPEEVDVEIDWGNDVEEHITTAQGPGGQNVNKVATAVHLIHAPSGIEVRMQESKSQQQNREKARRLLLTRLHELERQKMDAERSAERNSQIGSGERSEKIRVYRYQEGIVADQRLDQKHNLREVLAGNMRPMIEQLMERETARRLASL